MNQEYYNGLVRARLGDNEENNVHHTHDNNGNVIHVKTNIYQDGQILQYLELSLRRFNLLFDKDFELNDPQLGKFTDLIVQGAVINALASKALLERGREFTMKEDGQFSFTPPVVSELLFQQWINEQNDYNEKVKYLHKRFDYHYTHCQESPLP